MKIIHAKYFNIDNLFSGVFYIGITYEINECIYEYK